eukprot:3923925-Prymnesium_polylepis.2
MGGSGSELAAAVPALVRVALVWAELGLGSLSVLRRRTLESTGRSSSQRAAEQLWRWPHRALNGAWVRGGRRVRAGGGLTRASERGVRLPNMAPISLI